MANVPFCGNHSIYYNSINLHAYNTDLGRYKYRQSNLLFNLYASYFFKSLNGSWGRLKLFALHIHRARSPTAAEWYIFSNNQASNSGNKTPGENALIMQAIFYSSINFYEKSNPTISAGNGNSTRHSFSFTNKNVQSVGQYRPNKKWPGKRPLEIFLQNFC